MANMETPNKWQRIGIDDKVWHVVPVDDLRDHADDCWCSPKEKLQPNGAWVITHNSADGREIAEEHWPNIIT